MLFRSGSGSRGCREGSDAAFQCRHSFFQYVVRGVHQAGVDIAQFLQGEQSSGVSGVIEGEGTGAIDGDSARVGGGICSVTCMQAGGFKFHRTWLSMGVRCG